jgi:small-conductance mechanosensitive channel/CRP-like cAMP-binding protein
MAASELRRRAIFYLILAGSIVVTLFVLTLVEEWGHNYLIANWGFEIDPLGQITSKTGAGAPDMVTSTTVSLVENLLRIVKIVLWMVLVISTVRTLVRLVSETVFKNATHSEIASLVRTVVSVIVYIVAFFIIFQSQYPAIQLTPLFTGSAILGIVVGLALQDTLGNLFAGIALQADQSFQVGDVISISNRGTGIVESVSWRGLRIRTFQNKLLVISNAVLGKETIEVASQNSANARLVTFSTVYSDSPARTAQVIRDAVRQVENVSGKIRPIVRIKDFANDGIIWEIKYWLENYSRYNDTDALIRQRIWYTFRREGLSFAFPIQTIHIEKSVPAPTFDEYVDEASEYLTKVPIFAPLCEEEIQKLAETSKRRVFAPGEVIVRKGQEGGSMYVIVKGSVSVQLPTTNGAATINKLQANDFFGEMSLLTGEPRTANVVADDETEVLQIRKAAIKPIFEANPELLSSVSEIVEERRQLLQANMEASMPKIEVEESGLLGSIKRFFGMGD